MAQTERGRQQAKGGLGLSPTRGSPRLRALRCHLPARRATPSGAKVQSSVSAALPALSSCPPAPMHPSQRRTGCSLPAPSPPRCHRARRSQGPKALCKCQTCLSQQVLCCAWEQIQERIRDKTLQVPLHAAALRAPSSRTCSSLGPAGCSAPRFCWAQPGRVPRSCTLTQQGLAGLS